MPKSEDSPAKAPRKSEAPVTASGGTVFIRILVKVFILAFLSAYAAAAILVHSPADLSDVKGYPDNGNPAGTGAGADTPDIVQRLSDAVATRIDPVVLREDEVNAYIAAQLDAQQTGYSARYVTFGGVWVDFSKNNCRIYMEREAFGRPSTVAIDLKISREGDQFLTEFTGGQFGRLNVAQGFLLLVKHAYDRLATTVFPDEIDLIFQMNHIRFDEDQLFLDPRFPQPAG